MIMLSLLGAIGTALVYGLGGYFAIQKSIDPGALAPWAYLIGRIYTPLTGLTNARIDVLTALVSFDRVFEVLDAPSPLIDKPEAPELPRPVVKSSSTTSPSGTRTAPRPSSQALKHRAPPCLMRTARPSSETSR